MRIGALAHTLAKGYLHIPTRMRTHFLRGASGIGKTEVVYQMSDLISPHIEGWAGITDIRLSHFEPVDFRGIPFVNKAGRTSWAIPDIWPELNTSGLIFLDEITSAPPSLQAVAYQLCQERRIGNYKLPEGWMVVAAGNRQSDRGVTYNIAAPLLNRMTVLDVDTVFEDWQEYAASKGKRPEVIAMVKSRVDLLHKFDPKGVIEQFPSPRGWFAVSDILDADYDQKVRAELIKGAVGSEAGLIFEAYLRIYERIPDLDAIEKTPDTVEVPGDLDIRYCLAMGISARLSSKNFPPFWAFLKRMPRELQTLTVKLAYRRDKTIADCTAFGEWAAANADAFKRS
jgi:AAA domain (dynein-related subfamily)